MEHGGRSSDTDAIWEDFPLFAPTDVSIPKLDSDKTAEDVSSAMGALSHLLYDEETPQEKSELLRDEGNRYFKRGARGYANAIKKYNDAITAAADVPEALAPAYMNRSVAEFKLGNYARSLADAEQSLRYLPGNAKAHFRAMICAKNLGRFADAINHYRSGIAILGRSNSAQAKRDIRLFEAKKQEIEEVQDAHNKRQVERDERIQAKNASQEKLSAMLESRQITMGLPLFSQQRRYPIVNPVEKDEAWFWPVLLIYPEEVACPGHGDQSDYLEEVSEDATIEDIVASVFGNEMPPPAWDVNRRYKDPHHLEALFRAEWTMKTEDADSDDEETFYGSMMGPEDVGHWVSLSRSSQLRDILGRREYIVPLFPVLYIVPVGIHLT